MSFTASAFCYFTISNVNIIVINNGNEREREKERGEYTREKNNGIGRDKNGRKWNRARDLFFFFVNINEKKNHYKRRISKRRRNEPALRWS
tara:strand:+ start:949 stop:1221 length:273 start_codon:yes stop_codon:yes gene_type:complete